MFVLQNVHEGNYFSNGWRIYLMISVFFWGKVDVRSAFEKSGSDYLMADRFKLLIFLFMKSKW